MNALERKALGSYPADSIGGRAILAGRAAFDAGKPPPAQAWPYLQARGYRGRQAEHRAAAQAEALERLAAVLDPDAQASGESILDAWNAAGRPSLESGQ